MTKTGNKRHICSFIKKNEKGELKGNVIVITAPNVLIARVKLCEQHGVVNRSLKRNVKEEGIRSIRQSDTNLYEGESESDNFSNNTEIRK